jgi:hypothetical protein
MLTNRLRRGTRKGRRSTSDRPFGAIKELRTIASLPGYEDVRSLIPDGLFLHYTDVWRLSLEFYRNEFDELNRRMILEMVGDVRDRTADRVCLIMESPDQISFPDSWQITGLDVEDIRDRGLEDLRWRVYDYEMSGFSLYCRSIRLERRKNTEPNASPNAAPPHR